MVLKLILKTFYILIILQVKYNGLICASVDLMMSLCIRGGSRTAATCCSSPRSAFVYYSIITLHHLRALKVISHY